MSLPPDKLWRVAFCYLTNFSFYTFEAFSVALPLALRKNTIGAIEAVLKLSLNRGECLGNW